MNLLCDVTAAKLNIFKICGDWCSQENGYRNMKCYSVAPVALSLIFDHFSGVPTDAPKNISWRFQTPDVVEIVYDPPPEHARNGQVTKYEIQFWKGASPNEKKLRQTTEQKTVFANLDDNTEYKFSVRANTRKGYGPWSTQSSFRTDRNIVRAPLNVKAMATSDSSVQVNINHCLHCCKLNSLHNRQTKLFTSTLAAHFIFNC